MNEKALLENPKTSAVALLKALKTLGDFVNWEPETVWVEAYRGGIDIPTENRAKIMAALTLLLVPSFYWDAVVFEKTALALQGLTINQDTLEEASPAQLSWAAVEAAWILKEAHRPAWDFMYEPQAYAGVVLNRAGYVLAPAQLSFAQEALDKERHETSLFPEVKDRWASVSKPNLLSLKLEETPIDIQIARLASVELFIQELQVAAQRDLARLG